MLRRISTKRWCQDAALELHVTLVQWYCTTTRVSFKTGTVMQCNDMTMFRKENLFTNIDMNCNWYTRYNQLIKVRGSRFNKSIREKISYNQVTQRIPSTLLFANWANDINIKLSCRKCRWTKKFTAGVYTYVQHGGGPMICRVIIIVKKNKTTFVPHVRIYGIKRTRWNYLANKIYDHESLERHSPNSCFAPPVSTIMSSCMMRHVNQIIVLLRLNNQASGFRFCGSENYKQLLGLSFLGW